MPRFVKVSTVRKLLSYGVQGKQSGFVQIISETLLGAKLWDQVHERDLEEE